MSMKFTGCYHTSMRHTVYKAGLFRQVARPQVTDPVADPGADLGG